MYVDDNGIVRFENTDDLSPLHVQLNVALQSIRDRVNGLETDQIYNGDNFLRVGSDGAPRLWSDVDLVFGREYTGNRPDGSSNRLTVITPAGTFGALATTLHHDYMPYQMAGGRILLPTPTSGEVVSRTVTFPANRFTAAPTTAWATADTTVPGNPVQGVSVGSVTRTSMVIYLRRTSTADTAIYWGAVQL